MKRSINIFFYKYPFYKYRYTPNESPFQATPDLIQSNPNF